MLFIKAEYYGTRKKAVINPSDGSFTPQKVTFKPVFLEFIKQRRSQEHSRTKRNNFAWAFAKPATPCSVPLYPQRPIFIHYPRGECQLLPCFTSRYFIYQRKEIIWRESRGWLLASPNSHPRVDLNGNIPFLSVHLISENWIRLSWEKTW